MKLFQRTFEGTGLTDWEFDHDDSWVPYSHSVTIDVTHSSDMIPMSIRSLGTPKFKDTSNYHGSYTVNWVIENYTVTVNYDNDWKLYNPYGIYIKKNGFMRAYRKDIPKDTFAKILEILENYDIPVVLKYEDPTKW